MKQGKNQHLVLRTLHQKACASALWQRGTPLAYSPHTTTRVAVREASRAATSRRAVRAIPAFPKPT